VDLLVPLALNAFLKLKWESSPALREHSEPDGRSQHLREEGHAPTTMAFEGC
jgi:hypothetical protein